jgi:phytoene dehydrogenase-like protein
MDSNLVGGDIQGGVLDIGHFLFRPTRKHYATSNPKIYLCSASTPPGGGVHGMCGYHAANTALRKLGWTRESVKRGAPSSAQRA